SHASRGSIGASISGARFRRAGRYRAESEVARRALAQPSLRPHPTAVALHDPGDVGQPDPAAAGVFLGVQPLEQLEQAMRLRRIEADAVVLDREDVLAALLRVADPDHGLG